MCVASSGSRRSPFREHQNFRLTEHYLRKEFLDGGVNEGEGGVESGLSEEAPALTV